MQNLVAKSFKSLYKNYDHDPHTIMVHNYQHYLYKKAADILVRSLNIKNPKRQERLIKKANAYIVIATQIESFAFRERIINYLNR